MASVEKAETPITVNSVACSFFSCGGSAAESASAAEAPQIAVAPPDRNPNSGLNPMMRASRTEIRIVPAVSATTIRTGGQPSAVTCDQPILRPSRATPRRSSSLEDSSIPARVRGLSVRKLNAMPSSRA